MILRPRLNRFILVLLAIYLACASMWSYGFSAEARAVADDRTVLVATQAALGFDIVDASCSHGCHAQSHMVAINQEQPQWSSVNVRRVSTLPSDMPFSSITAEGPFRPPNSEILA